MGLVALQKGLQRTLSPSFCHMRVQCNLEEGPLREFPDLGFPTSRTLKNKFLLFIDTQSMTLC
jgi:hypothetical protein